MTCDFLGHLTGVSGAYSNSYAYNPLGNITSFNGMTVPPKTIKLGTRAMLGSGVLSREDAYAISQPGYYFVG